MARSSTAQESAIAKSAIRYSPTTRMMEAVVAKVIQVVTGPLRQSEEPWEPSVESIPQRSGEAFWGTAKAMHERN